MAVVPVWRRVARHFSISAPRMAVRTHLAWPWKAALAVAVVGFVGAMWWWGFDFGQILGGFNRKEIDHRMVALAEEADAARREAAALRAQNAQLEADLGMTRGLQGTLARQVGDLQHENAAIKEELVFLQAFFDGAAKPGLAIQRLAVERNGSDVARYSVLVVRGGAAKADFEGHVVLEAELVPLGGGADGAAGKTLSLPPEGAPGPNPLSLKFKYYQRLDGTFPVPPGTTVRAVTARVYESGTAAPRASRTLTLP